MHRYLEFSPNALLRPFLECVWSLRSHSIFFKKRELIIPGGRTEMMFNLDSPVTWIDSKDLSSLRSYAGAYLLGPRNRHFFVEMNGPINMVGVRFRHGGLASFTRIPVHALLNEVVPLCEVLGEDATGLVERLVEKENEHQQVNLVEGFLLKALQADSASCKTLELISWVKRCEPTSINVLSEKTGIHYKKLERTFSQYTGYNPKNFSRVIRFYESLRQMKKQNTSLTMIGLTSGYYDQPHFIRDFKAFTGKSPSQFHTENYTIANLLLKSQHV
jgi:AraC-like DNA-binding protein